jgi:hypothetical protein
MDERHSIERSFPGGHVVYAWLEGDGIDAEIKVQWRTNNKPKHQPFIVGLQSAPSIFRLLAEFADTLKKQQEA